MWNKIGVCVFDLADYSAAYGIMIGIFFFFWAPFVFPHNQGKGYNTKVLWGNAKVAKKKSPTWPLGGSLAVI